MHYSEIKVGDLFHCPPNGRRSSIGGKVVKVNPVNITYETQYEPCPGRSETMTLKTHKSDLIGGKVKRGEKIQEVTA